MWPQAIVQERVQKILGYKIGKWILYNKNIKILFFLKISPIRKCILGPQQIFNILTLFLFTLKADCNKKWTFSSIVNLKPLKINISLTFFEYSCSELEELYVFKNRIRLIYWYLVHKFALELTETKIRIFFTDSVEIP